MAAIEVGRVCVKTAGNDAGDKVTITKIIDKNFVEVKKENGKKAVRCSIRHLEPTSEVSKA
ncbi:MAG TPA: 50S ribosomal protein L14e [Candidatus Micrarchaeota archaeon]|nr:50S ribosomal protein L14e [Candidatus Micrarchaeota archaeon]